MSVNDPQSAPDTAYDYPTERLSGARTDRPEPPTSTPVQWGTVLASAGVAAVVSAVILSVGAVGVLVADRGTSTASPSTVVHLGPQATTGTGAPPSGSPAPSTTPTDGTVPVAPGLVDVPTTGTSPSGTAPATSSTTSTSTGEVTRTRPDSAALPANFRVTTDRPTLADLNDIVRFLVATPASDQAKAANVEGGMAAVVVPRTVYTLGLFRAPLGWSTVNAPLDQRGNSVTALLLSGSAGRPTIRMTVEFKKLDGNWKLAASSMCQGVKAVGLNIYCNR